MNCANCGALISASVPTGTGEPSCAACAAAGLAHGQYNPRVEGDAGSPGALSAAEAPVSAWLYEHGYTPTTRDQIECLLDSSRCGESLAMLSHWRARCGVPAELLARLELSVRLQAVNACMTRDQLVTLQTEWIGHGDTIPEDTETDLAEFMRGYAYEVYFNGGEAGSREHAPEVDPTSVTDWLSAALQSWCAVNGLPFECADDLLMMQPNLTPAQRAWLLAFRVLWDASA